MLSTLRQLYTLRSYSTSAKAFDKIPSPPLHPEYGSYPEFMGRIQQTDIITAIDSYYKEFGPIVRFKFGVNDEVSIFNPTEISHVIKNDNHIPMGPAAVGLLSSMYSKKYNRMFPLSESDERWKQSRAILQKDIFSPQVALTYVEMLNEPASFSSKHYDKAPFELLILYTAFDLFSSVILGKNMHSIERALNPNRKRDDFDEYVDGTMIALRALTGQLLHSDSIEKLFEEFERGMNAVFRFTDKYVEESAKTLNLTGKSYFERLLARKELSKETVSATISNFLLAGVDTTSSVALWTILNLGRFPHVQEKLYQEIKSVVGDGPVLDKHIEKLEYLKQVLRESHRYTPPSPYVTFRILDRPIEVCGYEIPAGVRINFGGVQITRDPKVVDRCNEFIPERWSKAEVEKRKGTPQEIIDSLPASRAFGLGPRMCMGARLAEVEIKVFLCHLLRDWEYHYDPNQQQHKVAFGTLAYPHPFPKMTVQTRK